MPQDEQFMQRAIDLALRAEGEGNPSVGAVIVLEGEVVSEGYAALLVPKFDGTRHAEMEALRAVPQELWEDAERMMIYSTLEPCLMCFAAIMTHGIGRVCFGAVDSHGGAGAVLDHLPPYFEKRLEQVEWLGPVMPEECNALRERLFLLLEESQLGLV
jgi:tRNA(adenine34) deaminase